ncbi:MAG TPA: polysaccharide lyase, partial [Polyangiaceae bacterium]|nr:polysaccharide lyase [Polyangiaceae bacterium]
MTLVKGLGTGLVVAACMLASRESSATVIFHNTGTLSGWSGGTNAEHNGSIAQVTNIVFAGTTAIKATQVFDSSYTGRYHSEATENNVYARGDTGFYGFAFRLQADWQFESQSYNIAQFIADFSDTGCDDFMPSTMVWLSGSNLTTRVKTGTPCAQKTTTFNGIATVSAGVWHRVELQVDWQSNTTGFFKVWFDG